ncbi:MAG: acetylxylan esterase [Candidatus Latescibacterota bacterium]|nr:acetylxylan esterase [Candidatus Latescibacterota bacterium]
MSRADINYDEAAVANYELPDPLRCLDGRLVENAEEWRQLRRPEVLQLFAEHVYGVTPPIPIATTSNVVEEGTILGGRARRRQVRLRFGKGRGALEAELLLYLPRVRSPAPVFIGLNFHGNQTVRADPEIRMPQGWVRGSRDDGIFDHRATEASRGIKTARWQVERVVNAGYGVATVHNGDFDPDFDDGYVNGVHPLFPDYSPAALGGAIDPKHRWGTIGAWAWGLSRCLDYLRTDNDIDAERVCVMGHSRLGKTALWAGAQDERFALVISNNSGCGGAALSRRNYGETVRSINDIFPHWFCDRFREYNGREGKLPVDQHLLVSLSAPRPVYLASAEQDRWADPKGEFLAARHAGPVYHLFTLQGLKEDETPPIGAATASGHIGYHQRPGGHDVTAFDWEQWIDFANLHLGAP